MCRTLGVNPVYSKSGISAVLYLDKHKLWRTLGIDAVYSKSAGERALLQFLTLISTSCGALLEYTPFEPYIILIKRSGRGLLQERPPRQLPETLYRGPGA